MFFGLVIVALVSIAPSQSYANCSSNTPSPGSTVTCSDADTTGIVGAVGVSNVTVDITSTGSITVAVPLIERGSGWVVNNGGSMRGTNFAIQTAGAAGSITVVNTGSITASGGSGQAIAAVNGAFVTNSGTISGTLRSIVSSGSFSTIVNSGTIRTTAVRASNPFALLLNAGGSVTNQLGGTIFSEQFAVRIADGPTTNEVINSGTISGTASDDGNAVGVFISPGATGAATITNNNTGTITGGRGGAGIDAGFATVINSGVISGTVASRIIGISNQYGLYLWSGSVTNTAIGSIRGFDFGVQIPSTGGGGTLSNSGIISASASSGIGVLFGAGGTITNEAGGTITGGGGTAVSFAGANVASSLTNRGTLNGSIVMGNGSDTVVLAAGAFPGQSMADRARTC